MKGERTVKKTMAAQTGQMSASQINSIARQAIQARGVRMLQQIFSQQYTTPLPTQVTVNPRNVGLLLGFWVKVTGIITNSTASSNLTLSDFGPVNMLSQIQFYDLSNNLRIQTTGWHLNFVNSWKRKQIFGSALIGASGANTGLDVTPTFPTLTYQGEDSPTNYGSNWTVNTAPASIAENGGTGTVTQWYYVPLAYNPDNPKNPDFRGAVYANVVNATMQLILSLPGAYGSQLAAAYGTDSTSAVYLAAANNALTAALSPLTVTVYQDYYDQLPVGNNGVLLPILDLATIYELKYTNATAISPNQDYPYQYANFRDFLSTCVVYVNTAATGARGNGADVNTWALQSANFTNIWKIEPDLAAIMSRRHIGADFPPGVYWFDSRDRPISTTQYGNMQLVLNAATAGTGAYMLIGVEDFSLVQSLSMAGSLAAS